MQYWPFKSAMNYINKISDADERVFLFESLKLFDEDSRANLMSDDTLVPIKDYDNLHEIRFSGERGQHRFIGPIIGQVIYLVHAFRKQGKAQEQKEYKIGWKKAKKVINYIK